MSERGSFAAGSGCHVLTSCELVVDPSPWAWAERHGQAVDRHWRTQSELNPRYFNGTIHVLADLAFVGRRAEGRFLRTDFKSFLYWRDQGFPEAGVLDCFGSALIRSRDGAILLGRQAGGQVNSGLTYLPGGFIDERDVAPDGRILLADSIAREIAEETGLDPAHLVAGDRYILTRCGQQASFAREFCTPLDADTLAEQVRSFLSRDDGAELADVVMIHDLADIARLDMPEFARMLVRHVLAANAEG